MTVAMEPRRAERCRYLGEIAGWIRRAPRRRLRDGARGRACRSSSAATIRSRWARSAASPGACAETGRELAVLWLDAHADYNTPETTPVAATCTAWRCRFLAGEPEPARRSSATGRFDPVAPGDIHVFGARSIDPGEQRAAARRTASTSSTCGRSTSAASRRCSPSGSRGWQARGRAPARQLRRRLPRPGGRAGHRHRGAGRRHLPRGAPGHGDALRLRASSARSTSSSSTPSSTSAAAPPSPPPSWSRASSAAPSSTASPGAVSPPDLMPGETTMLDTAGLIDLETRLGARNYKPLDVVLTEGEGVWVTDIEGNRYLDCLAAYSAVNQGHCHPKILAAMVEQAGRLTLTSRAFRNDQLGPLLRGARRADQLAQGAADELRRRGGGDRDQGGAQVGLRGQGRAGGPGRDHRLRRQLPRPHARRSSPSRPTRTPAAASARSCPAS